MRTTAITMRATAWRLSATPAPLPFRGAAQAKYFFLWWQGAGERKPALRAHPFHSGLVAAAAEALRRAVDPQLRVGRAGLALRQRDVAALQLMMLLLFLVQIHRRAAL